MLTELFGVGWPDAPHRVAPNAATERWLRPDPRGPGAVRLLHRISAPLGSRMPQRMVRRVAEAQRPGLPLYGPASPVEGDPDSLVDAAPLYAGECVARIHDLRPAGEITRELARSLGGAVSQSAP
jgi:nitronate monooxygenase